MTTKPLAPPGHSAFDVATAPMQRVHTPEHLFSGFGRAVREVVQYRELLGQLIRKELKIKYKDSVLGFLWTLLRPLTQLLVYSLAIGFFLGASKNIPEFGVYLFTGLLAWTLFTEILGGCTTTIIGNSGLIKKVYLPSELFPLSVVGASLVNFALQLVILFGAWAATGKWPDPSGLPLVLLALVVLLVFGTALGLVLSAVNVYLRDVQYLVEVSLLLWFWMTPIIYDWTKVHDKLVVSHHLNFLYQIYMANPIANIALAFQRVLWPAGKGTAFYYAGNLYLRLLILLGVCLVLLWAGQRVFARSRGNFAQEL